MRICTFCGVAMKLKASNMRIDKLKWRCMNFHRTKYQTSASFRYNYMFANFKIEYQLILESIYYIYMGLQPLKISQLTEIKKKVLNKI